MDSMLIIFVLLIVATLVISMWILFDKAGEPGWAAIVPIYNILTLLKIVNKPWWWLLLMMIPYAGIVWNIWSLNLFVKSFGKSEGYTVGCIFLPFIFLPMLAATGIYQGQSAQLSNPEVLDQGI